MTRAVERPLTARFATATKKINQIKKITKQKKKNLRIQDKLKRLNEKKCSVPQVEALFQKT